MIQDYYFNGGGSRMLATTCNLLLEKFQHITVFTFLKKGDRESNYKLDERINIVNINMRYIKIIRHLKSYLYLKKNIHALQEYDVIIGVDITTISMLGKLKNKIRTNKVYGWCHMSYCGISFILKILCLPSYKYLDKLIILTKYDIKNFEKINQNIVVINNFLPERYKKVDGSFYNHKFLFVGRMDKRQKGIDLLCNILRKYYTKSNNPWSCKIIASGKYEKIFNNYIKKFKIEKFIERLDNTNNIQKEYMQASCLLITSRYEGLPMVLLEAISFGLPVISFDCQTGPAEVLNDGEDGYLVNPGDSETFAQRMIELQSNKEKYESMSEKAYIISEKYYYKNILSELTEAIEK
jgi:glycosyltransferase involved in cell wall biosynthesis